MIEKIIKNGYFNFEKFLFENYTSLNLTSDEVFVCIGLIKVFFDKKGSFKMAAIKQATNFDEKLCSKIVSDLLDKKILEIDTVVGKNGKLTEVFTLKGLFSLIEDNINEIGSSNQMKQEITIQNNDQLEEIVKMMENNFNRNLNHFEIDTIFSWIDSGIIIEDINNALVYAKKNHRLNFKFLDAFLIENKNNKVEVDEETSQFINDFLKGIKR